LRAGNWQFTQYRRQEESTEVAPEKGTKETRKAASKYTRQILFSGTRGCSHKRRVLAVCGDGGFMTNSQEMETAVRLGLNLVVLIIQIAPPGQKGFYASWQSASQQVAVKFPALTGAF
jgi:hypothetical protein